MDNNTYTLDCVSTICGGQFCILLSTCTVFSVVYIDTTISILILVLNQLTLSTSSVDNSKTIIGSVNKEAVLLSRDDILIKLLLF